MGAEMTRNALARPSPRLTLTLIGSIIVVACSGAPSVTDSGEPMTEGDAPMGAADPKAQFLGTWELARVDRIGSDGEMLPPPEPGSFGGEGSLGYLMYDPSGHMSVVLMQGGRQPYVGDDPTPAEALVAFNSYIAYFGTFSVNEAEGYLTHHLQGDIRPPASSNNNQRFYELTGDDLTLMPPVGDSGIQLKIAWRRLPLLPESQLTDTHRRLFGFYQIDHVERHTLDGEEIPRDQYDNAFIIYMPSGHMAVHLMRPDRPDYSGTASPEEARAALATYSSYLGPFSVHEADGYLVHHRIGTTNPSGTPSDAQRFYDLTDTTLTLRPPVSTDDQGREGQSALTWRKISD